MVPSGKLADTFAKDYTDYPSAETFQESDDYVCYTDDIFVGYRYFETIPGASEKVNFPFGYGLSYTVFSRECTAALADEEKIRVDVRVTNIGAMAGKEVIQVYSSFSDTKANMPHLQLRGFAKTRLLQPGESQNLQVEIPLQSMALFSEEKAAWILPRGRHIIHAGGHVRDLQTVYVYSCENDRAVFHTRNRCVPTRLPCRMISDGSYQTVTQHEELFRLSPDGWPENCCWQAEHILPDMRGVPLPEGRASLEAVLEGKMSLDDYIKDLRDEELITLLGGTYNRGIADTRGIGGLDYRGIPAIMTADGPAGLRVREDRGVKTTAWPIATSLACSWDSELVFAVAEAGAKEVLENNIGVWLTPGINIHRNPLCGRNFEYFSEDPFLTGKLASALVRGIQSQGVSACAKHFCVNNKEKNRYHSDSRVSERALREIYLKAFEIVVKEAHVWCVMTAYNKLNGIYTSEHQELLEGILREEWGYEGLIITDWGNSADHYREIMAGNNVRMPCGSLKRLQRALELNYIQREDLEKSVKYLLTFMMRLV